MSKPPGKVDRLVAFMTAKPPQRSSSKSRSHEHSEAHIAANEAVALADAREGKPRRGPLRRKDRKAGKRPEGVDTEGQHQANMIQPWQQSYPMPMPMPIQHQMGLPQPGPQGSQMPAQHQMALNQRGPHGPQYPAQSYPPRKTILPIASSMEGPEVPPKPPANMSRPRVENHTLNGMNFPGPNLNQGQHPRITENGVSDHSSQGPQTMNTQSWPSNGDLENHSGNKVMEQIHNRLVRFQRDHQRVRFDWLIPTPCRLIDIEMGLCAVIQEYEYVDQRLQQANKVESKYRELEKSSLEMLENNSKMEAECQELLDGKAALEKERKELMDRIATMEREHGRLDGVIETLREDKTSREQKHDDHITDVRKSHDADKNALIEEHKLQQNKLNDRMIAMKNQYEDDLIAQRKLNADAQAIAKEELERQKREAQGNIIAISQSYEEEKRQTEYRLNQEIERLQREVLHEREEKNVALEKEKDKHHKRVGLMTEEHEEFAQNKAKEIDELKSKHETEKQQMLKDHETEKAVLVRSLKENVASLKGALTKRDHFKTLSDYELATCFQDIGTEIDDIARVEWDNGQALSWPFSEGLLQASENPRRAKQHIIQNTLWVILYERIFCTPFRVFGEEGRVLETYWVENFGRGGHGFSPKPTRVSEKWRYDKMKICAKAASEPQMATEETYNVSQGYGKTIQDTTVDISKELKKVAKLSGKETQRIPDLVRKAAKLWLDVGQQRCRVFLVMSDTGNEPVRSSPSSLGSNGVLNLVVAPELRRAGNAQGEQLEKEERVKDCKGKFSVFRTG